MAKKYKCPYCEERLIRKDLINHIDKKHEVLIPQEYTSSRLVYNQVNKVDQGKCRVCGNITTWNEKSGRYNVLCNNPKCKEHMREEYKKNMLKVRGTYNILSDPEQQRKMLANRSISGTYKFTDGGSLIYTGSYEKKCLEFMDVVMQIPSKDILSPGPTLEYMYNGVKHFYITDFYYIPYNLIIEVKDGGDNLNTKESPSMKASREKTIEKERIITDRGEYNYIRLTNNNFAQLIEIFMDIKQKLLEGDDSKTYKINESGMILESYFNESNADKTFTDMVKELRYMYGKDLYYNRKKFETGDTNICFVFAGNLGSIKGTPYNKRMSVGWLEALCLNYQAKNDEDLINGGDMVYHFLTGPGSKYRYHSKKEFINGIGNKTNKEWVREVCKNFIKFSISYSKKCNEKCIVFGGYSMTLIIDFNDIKESAIFIKDKLLYDTFFNKSGMIIGEYNINLESYFNKSKSLVSMNEIKQLSDTMKKEIKYSSPNNWIFKSPKEVGETKCGNCHD